MPKATSGKTPGKKKAVKKTGTKKPPADPGTRQGRRKNVPASKQAWEDGVSVMLAPNETEEDES